MSTLGETTGTTPRPHRGDDLHAGIIYRVVLVFIGGIVLALTGAALLFHVFAKVHPGRTSEAAPVVTTADLPPQPRLQMNPARDLEQVRAVEDLHLDRYAWIDRTRGIAQIPIDRAMTLWLQSSSNTPPTPGPRASVYFFSNPTQGGTSLNRTSLFWKSPGNPTTPNAGTNTIIAPAVTELQMRQDKAKEAPHAP
jgi:hypothetical protein